jgi:DNA-binding transcriptional MerR regulator
MLYSKTRLTRLLNISPHLMRKLEKEGILQPKKKIRNRKYYGFNEYLGLRIIQRLRENGISPKKMVASLKSVQKSFQKLKSPLTEVKFISVGKEVVMKYGGNVIDSDGQYLLPQLFEEGKADVYSLSQTAWYWFEMANKYDQEPETYSKAEFYYKQALHYQPEMFEALMNLGTLYYKSGKMKAAETYYLKALKLEPAN